MKIWQRHLLGRLFKTLALILASLFCIYTLMDLSVHGIRFFSGTAGGVDLILYYVRSFSQHLDLFFSLSFLLTTLKVLSDLAHHSELIALHMAGLSMKKLAAPLFAVALTLAVLSLVNAEWLSPQALDSIDAFRATHAKRKKSELRSHAQTASFGDGSELVYQSFDPKEKTLFDVFWLRNSKEIWHIKTLTMQGIGSFVDCFERNANKQMALIRSFENLQIEGLYFSDEEMLQKFVPFENRPLKTLLFQSVKPGADVSAIRAHLHYKLALALLPLLIAFTLSPHLLRFSRTKPLFLIASASLFLLVGFLTVLDGMLILAENRVLPPAISIWLLSIFSLLGAARQWIEGIANSLRRSKNDDFAE